MAKSVAEIMVEEYDEYVKITGDRNRVKRIEISKEFYDAMAREAMRNPRGNIVLPAGHPLIGAIVEVSNYDLPARRIHVWETEPEEEILDVDFS